MEWCKAANCEQLLHIFEDNKKKNLFRDKKIIESWLVALWYFFSYNKREDLSSIHEKRVRNGKAILYNISTKRGDEDFFFIGSRVHVHAWEDIHIKI